MMNKPKLKTKLSKNFYLEEFIYSNTAKTVVKIKKYSHEYFCLINLVEKILQPTRSYIKTSIQINNGIRNKKIWTALYKAGYKPSKTTDHSYGLPEVNQYGVGAADFCCPRKEPEFLEDVFKWIQNQEKRLKLHIGQCILYFKRGKPHFIHISNPKYLIYSPIFCAEILKPKVKFMFKINGKFIQVPIS